MSVPAWEATLPTELLTQGYEETTPEVSIKSNMDTGPAKVRRRVTAAVRPVKGSIIVTATQLGTFKTFYNTTLLGGTLRFSWKDPADGTTAVEMRFTETPKWTVTDDPELYQINMSLEILP